VCERISSNCAGQGLTANFSDNFFGAAEDVPGYTAHV
jgi:hypothetical protein